MVLLLLVTVTTELQCSLNGSKSPNFKYLEIVYPLGFFASCIKCPGERFLCVHLFPVECHGSKMSLCYYVKPFVPLSCKRNLQAIMLATEVQCRTVRFRIWEG